MEKNKLEGLEEYILNHSLRESRILAELRTETATDPSAIMQIPPNQGQLMAFLLKAIGAKRAIEVGVYTGYSTLCLAQAMPENGYIVACDINEQWAKMAQSYWNKAEVSHKIDLKIAPAVETLQSLLNDGQSESYDFIFIDADKENYDNYYELSLRLLRPGGIIAIDNVLLFGAVVDSNVLSRKLKAMLPETSIQAVRDLNIKIHSDKRVDITMLPIADGITLARKI